MAILLPGPGATYNRENEANTRTLIEQELRNLKRVTTSQTSTSPVDLVFEFGDAVTAPAVNSIAGHLEIDFNCLITRATIVADAAGSAVVDIQTATFADPPVFASIAASDKPTLSTQTAVQDIALTGWTKAIGAGALVRAKLSSLTTCKKITVTLTLTRT